MRPVTDNTIHTRHQSISPTTLGLSLTLFVVIHGSQLFITNVS